MNKTLNNTIVHVLILRNVQKKNIVIDLYFRNVRGTQRYTFAYRTYG